MSTTPLDIYPRNQILWPDAGGGLDFLCGRSIVIELEEMGRQVHVVNYSFTNLR